MARLGKRERHAKRALIKANLSSMANGTFERSSGDLAPLMNHKRLMLKSHTMGARVPQNVKGSKPKPGVGKSGRWSNV